MTPDPRARSLPRLTAIACVLAWMFTPLVFAQGVYRIVGPDGKVTFSDQPPAEAAGARPVGGGAPVAASSAALPLELRNATSRYPVTLYAGNDCSPCDKGRSFLAARGIPFNEKTVNTNDDIAALKRLSGATSLPMLTIGAQQLKGYSETEWTRYLDAAGYPKKSTLPASYRRAAAAPLVEATAAPAPVARAAAERPPADAPAEVPVAPPVTNPSGIRF